MIEPSWVRPRDVCLTTCVEENIQPCLTSSACDSGFDPLDCTKPYGSFSGQVDPQQLDGTWWHVCQVLLHLISFLVDPDNTVKL